VSSSQIHGETKGAPKPIKIPHHGYETAIEVLTQAPMNDRIYHSNYDPFEQK